MKSVALAVASVCLMLGSLAAPVAHSATAFSPDLEKKAERFRAGFGFQSDPTYVQRSLIDSAAFPDNQYGLPLTQAEAAEVQRRIKVELAVTSAVEWAAAQADFGGWYMDQNGGGVPVIQVAGDPAAFGKTFGQYVDGDLDYRVVEVKNAQQTLQALENRIWADRADLAKEGIDIQGVALDIRNNVVRVEVGGLTDHANTVLLARYGSVEAVESVEAEWDACNSRTDCAPPKGGIQIINVQHPTSGCTIGFNVKLNSSGARKMLTAGHCLIESPAVLGNGWKHHGVQIGIAETARWINNGNYDVGLISEPAIPLDDNLVYWGSNADVPHVKGWRVLAAQTVGSFVCRAGAYSGLWCGNVTAIEQMKNVDGFVINHMWVVDVDAIPGDSGAPYGLRTDVDTWIAWGTHSHSIDNHAPPGGSGWYAPFPYSMTGLELAGKAITLCTNPTCS